MEDEEMEKKVQQYLQRKGFRFAPSPPPNVPYPGMPGGFVSYIQNGHCYYPAPWPPPPPPPGRVSVAEPLSNSITQHDALGLKAKPVINIDDGDDVRTEKRLPWMPDEDVRLVNAWLKCSNDPISGKKTEQYWGALLEVYNSDTPTKRQRKAKHLKDRFQKIKRWVWFFCNSWKKATSETSNGQSKVDLRDMALKYYLDDYNEGPFTVMHCWKVLRDEPKWHAVLEELEKSNKRKLGDEEEVGNSTPTREEIEEQEHPLETRQAKKHCNGKGKVSTDGTGLKEDIKTFLKIQARAKRRHEEFIEVQQRISDAKIEAARLKRETAMLKTYKSLWTVDSREMSDEMKAEHVMGLKILREKLFGDSS